MNEWTPIPGYEGRYEMRSDGRLRKIEEMTSTHRPGMSAVVNLHPPGGRRHQKSIRQLLKMTFGKEIEG